MALSLILWSPLAFALLLALWPGQDPGRLRRAALALSLVHLAGTAWLLRGFDPQAAGMQFTERAAWLPGLGASYSLGLDGISLWLVVLNALLLPVAVLASWNAVQEKVRPFHALLFALQGLVHGVFLSQDVLLFYLFWEASLLPMYFLIGVWGGERRLYATVKFVLYTLAGSLLMLVAMLWLSWQAQVQTGSPSFDLEVWRGLELGLDPQKYLFLAFFLAFAIKVPLFPFHTWLPDAHVEAPTAGSIVLAGVLLKLGTYGLMRFNQALFPEACLLYQTPVIALSLLGALYGAAMVLVQTDFKKMVAYSSVSHMGLCVLGLFSFNLSGQQGALLTMVNHGLSTGALFLIVGMFYERTHTRELSRYGGAALKMPVMGLLFLPVAMSSMGVPGTNGFINEFLCLRGAFMAAPWAGVAASLSIVLGAAYMLRLTQKVMYGSVGEALQHGAPDLDRRETLVLGALVALILALGVYPNAVLHASEPAVAEGLARVARLLAVPGGNAP